MTNPFRVALIHFKKVIGVEAAAAKSGWSVLLAEKKDKLSSSSAYRVVYKTFELSSANHLQNVQLPTKKLH